MHTSQTTRSDEQSLQRKLKSHMSHLHIKKIKEEMKNYGPVSVLKAESTRNLSRNS